MADTDPVALLAAKVTALQGALAPFVAAYRKNSDPGTSDLDNEQPVAWHVPLGAYRRALLLQDAIKPATAPQRITAAAPFDGYREGDPNGWA